MRKNDLIGLLPLRNQNILIADNQSTFDIIQEVVLCHKIYGKDYNLICEYFDYGNTVKTLETLFQWIKQNIRYEIETENNQSVKSPAVILLDGKGDCKHYSLFSAGVLKSLGYDVSFRFASYDIFNPKASHVFCVVNPGSDGEIWFDCVLSYLNERLPLPVYYYDVHLK